MKTFVKYLSFIFLYVAFMAGIQAIMIAAVQAQGVQGLAYETYRGTGASPSINPLTYPTVLSTGVSATINYPIGSFGSNLLGSGRIDQVIVRWTGYINIATAGTYTFGAAADDGVIVDINNTRIIDSWVDSGNGFRTGTPITLSAGVYPITVWYYENGGGQAITFQWLVNSSWQIVPATVLATESTYFAPPAPQYVSNITTAQQARKDSATVRRQSVTANSIYITQVGDNNTVTVSQQGTHNQVRGVGQQAAVIDGNSNNITVRQGNTMATAPGRNLVEMTVIGDSNTVNLNQARNTDGTTSGADSNNHYQQLTLSGSNNAVTTAQKDGTAAGAGHFMENTISGNSNIVNLTQQGSAGKVLFTNISGNTNNLAVNQKDTGTHYLDVGLVGNGHSVNVVQEGAGSHRATINLTNSGAAGTVNLNQSGTNPQIYSIQQTCTTTGCGATITQNQ